MADDAVIRVAQVVRPAEGGIRRHVSLLVGEMDPRSFISSIFAPADFALENVSAPQYEIDIASTTNPLRDLRAISSLARMLRGSYDLVHAHGMRAAVVGVFAASAAHVPAIFTAHNTPPEMTRLQKLVLASISHRCSGIIAVSNSVSKALQAQGVPASQLHVVGNGIELSSYTSVHSAGRAEFGIRDDELVAAFVGRLSREKGLDTLLEAFRSVVKKRTDTHLLVIGTGPDEDRLRDLACNNLAVHFLGYRNNVAEMLTAADMIVVPSYTEGQGIVAIEAMACCKPVIATYVGGLPETVIDGETGLLVAPNNSQQLADAILTLAASPELRTRFGMAGKQRAINEYSIEKSIQSVQGIYRTVLGRS